MQIVSTSRTAEELRAELVSRLTRRIARRSRRPVLMSWEQIKLAAELQILQEEKDFLLSINFEP